MNEVKLSKRLEEVVREIPVGSTVADIGRIMRIYRVIQL